MGQTVPSAPCGVKLTALIPKKNALEGLMTMTAKKEIHAWNGLLAIITNSVKDIVQ